MVNIWFKKPIINLNVQFLNLKRAFLSFQLCDDGQLKENVADELSRLSIQNVVSEEKFLDTLAVDYNLYFASDLPIDKTVGKLQKILKFYRNKWLRKSSDSYIENFIKIKL